MARKSINSILSPVADAAINAAKSLPLTHVNTAKDLLELARRYGDEKQKHKASEVAQHIHEMYMQRFRDMTVEPYKGREIPRLAGKKNIISTTGGCEGCEQAITQVFKGKVPKFSKALAKEGSIDVPDYVDEVFKDYSRLREIMAIKKHDDKLKKELSMMFTKYFNKSKANRSRGKVSEMLTNRMFDILNENGYNISPSGKLVSRMLYYEEE